MNLQYLPFSEINFDDRFFDSLKNDYQEITSWFEKKSRSGDRSYVFFGDSGEIDGFLYWKIEDGVIDDISPPLNEGKHLKIGTFKINAHGTKLGERFLKKIFDHMLNENVDDAYVTVFEKHSGLISLFEKYGFIKHGSKTTQNGTEWVLIKNFKNAEADPVRRFPVILSEGANKYLLAIYPDFHTRLFPDSILRNEDANLIVRDISHTNSIHKVYICAMSQVLEMRRGDILVIYRTSDNQGPARFRAVATSICVIEEARDIADFPSLDEFLRYCSPHSVFSKKELIDFYQRRRYPYIIKFLYNIALPKRPNRGLLIDEAGLDERARWGCLRLTDNQFRVIAQLGNTNESLIIN